MNAKMEKVKRISQLISDIMFHKTLGSTFLEVKVRLVKSGSMSGLMCCRTPYNAGFCFLFVLPDDWVETVYDAGLHALFIRYGVFPLYALEVNPEGGAGRAWLVNVVRLSQNGTQFGIIASAVEFAGKLYYHSDGQEKAMELAAEELATGLGVKPQPVTGRVAGNVIRGSGG